MTTFGHSRTETLVVHNPTLGSDSHTPVLKLSSKINVSQFFNYQSFL